MSPDIFLYRPSGNHLPGWERIPYGIGGFKRQYDDPKTGVSILEIKRLNEWTEKYTRIESIPNGSKREITYLSRHRPGSLRSPRSVMVTTFFGGSNEKSKAVFYMPDNEVTPVSAQICLPETPYEFDAYYKQDGRMLEVELDVDEQRGYDEGIEEGNRERRYTPYEIGLTELADLLQLEATVPLFKYEITDQRIREISGLLKRADLHWFAQKFILTGLAALGDTGASEKAQEIMQKLVLEAFESYKIDNEEPVKRRFDSKAAENEHPFVSHLNYAVGEALNSYYNSLEPGIEFVARFAPLANGEFVYLIQDRDGTPLIPKARTRPGALVHFEGHDLSVTKAEDETIVLQVGQVGSKAVSKPRYQMVAQAAIPIESVIKQITTIDSTDWQQVIPLVAPIYKAIK
ncbi:MAG: hypothetical protein HY428_01460 [Candidatus Levybacteria bacterium]|nr:hypothetical protein [Candidatus Levybacteria bacterium]